MTVDERAIEDPELVRSAQIELALIRKHAGMARRHRPEVPIICGIQLQAQLVLAVREKLSSELADELRVLSAPVLLDARSRDRLNGLLLQHEPAGEPTAFDRLVRHRDADTFFTAVGKAAAALDRIAAKLGQVQTDWLRESEVAKITGQPAYRTSKACDKGPGNGGLRGKGRGKDRRIDPRSLVPLVAGHGRKRADDRGGS